MRDFEKTLRRSELLCPAGTPKHMDYAYAYGADAVYAGQPRYSLRARNNDFDFAALKAAIAKAHALGKKFFVAANLIAHNGKVETFMRDIAPIIAQKPDALIMADPGLVMMVRERFPEQAIHLSVQANTTNYAAVKFWHSVGIERVILSRELALEEIEEIRQRCPDIGLEVFVHGALCIAYSGRCLLSGYFNHRDPNQGTCTNACRWEYDVKNGEQNLNGDIEISEKSSERAGEKIALIEERGRPGERMPVFEDAHGTYIMNSKDLRAVEHIHALMKIGVDSFKIEGRTKSPYYVARTAQIYAQVIDDALAGKAFDPAVFGALENLANRGYTDGFLRRHQPEELQNYLSNYSSANRQKVVGEILDYQNGRALIAAKNKFSVDDSIEVILPAGNFETTVQSIEDERGKALQSAKGSGYKVWIPMQKINPNFGFIAKNLDEKIQIKSKYIDKNPAQKIRRPAW